jgi:cytochrome P450
MEIGADVFVALAAVAWADGVVAPEEADALLTAARACGLDDDELRAVRASLTERVGLERVGKLALSPDGRTFVYAIACWLSRVDGEVAPEEQATLAQLAMLLRLSDQDRELAASARLLVDSGESDLRAVAREIEAARRGEAAEELALPPGGRGWPVLGETLAFVRDPFGWVHEHVERLGRTFRARVLGRDTIVIVGPAAAALWIDQNKLMRDGSMFDHIFGLFGGYSLPSLDGEVHRARKHLVLAGFGKTALESYGAALQVTIGRALARWSEADEIRLVPELRTLAIEGIAGNMLGMERGPELERLVADYETVTCGFAAIPLAIPGTALYRANKARDRLLDTMRREVAARRASAMDDGFSRILAAKAPDGSMIDDDAAALELHHIFLAGYIVFAELAALVQRLDLHADVRERLRREIAALPPAPSLAELESLPLLACVVDETKRITPMLPIIFAKAKTTFEHAGFRVPEGWQVCLALHEHHVLGDVWPDPHRFDPERFAAGRPPPPEHAFAPQGPGPLIGHKCPGTDYATLFMKTFTVSLLRGYGWELPAQDLGFDPLRLPPEPKDGLRARVRRIAAT